VSGEIWILIWCRFSILTIARGAESCNWIFGYGLAGSKIK